MNAADWLERNLAASGSPRTLTDDERRCVKVLASIDSIYNLHTPGQITEMIEFGGGGLTVLLHGELATYDASALTRLVVASHANHVRVAISPWVSSLDAKRATVLVENYREEGVELDPDAIAGVLEVRLSPRAAGVTDQCWDGHPTLADLTKMAGDPRSEIVT